MKTLMALEMGKIIKRKELVVSAGIMILIPLAFSFCVVNKIAGLEFAGQISSDEFGVFVWSFLKYLFIIYLLPVALVSSFLGKELEDRSIIIMLSSRKKSSVLLAKLVVYALMISIFFILFQLSCHVAFSLFIQGSEFAVAAESTLGQTLFLYGLQWLELIFVILLTSVFCCLVKGNAALLLGLGAIILQRFLMNIESIRHFLPVYLSDYGSYSLLKGSEAINVGFIYLITYTVILTVLCAVAALIWRRKDF